MRTTLTQSLSDRVIEKFKEGSKVRNTTKEFGISISLYYKILRKEGLIKEQVKRDWIEEKKKIIHLYKEEESITAINEFTGVTRSIISRFIKQDGNSIRPKSFYTERINTFNHAYFEKINTAPKAYFLGLLYADGNVYLKRNRTQISLQQEDWYIIERFQKELGGHVNTYLDRGKYPKLILDSKKMMNDLISLGCVPAKSLILKYPTTKQVPEEYTHHFIRGYFDGDGGAYLSKYNNLNISFTSTVDFCNTIKGILLKEGIESTSFKKRYKDKEVSAGSINICRKESTKKLYKYMYRDCEDFYLKRKKEKFDMAYENICE